MMRRIRTDERGSSLIIVAVSLVVLLGFAAVAVDGAAAWALKRQDQSAADTGVLAGALQTSGVDKTTAIEGATDEIIRITYINVDPDMDLAAWKAEWASCVDPAKPGNFTEPGVSSDAGLGTIDCISFTDNLQDVRVVTPVIPWDTTFAKVIGFDQIDTRAEAEVHIEYDIPGGVLPFGMPGGAAGGEVCLKTGANPKGVAPCDGPDEGNFGFLDFTQFGNTDFGTTKTCTGGGTSRLERNIAQGIDHGLGTWDTDPASAPVSPTNLELDACNDGAFLAYPYQVATQTGNVAQALDDGLADGTDGLNGKLAGGPNRINVRGNSLDNTTLRSFLTVAGKNYCDGVVTDGDTNTHEEMAECLDAWVPAAGVIFAEDNGSGPTAVELEDAPRLGWVPLLWENFGPGTTTMTIKDIIPIYIQTTFWKCNASGCDLEWDPGEPVTPGANNVLIEASTALRIPKGALPSSITDSAPGTQDQVNFLLSK